ncbi:MAG: VOC family protein [Nocardioides sp.]
MSGVTGFTGWIGTVLDTPEPRALGAFYAGLVGGEVDATDPGFVTLRLGEGSYYLAFQTEARHARPTWPAGPGDQQMQLHLDIGVSDVEAAVRDAEALGARLADLQPQEDVRVMLDPAGHPFCLYLDTD